MKKYSEKFINQVSKLKNAKIGFEFEFYMRDLSYYKTLEILNKELSPVKVWGFRQYHSGFKPDGSNFKIEPDLSGGSNMVELVTGPLDYFSAKYYLVKIINFIQNLGYTNEKCSIHFNISFSDQSLDLSNLNILKLILSMDEEEVYRYFPSRKGNVYAKSIKKIIPYKEYDFFNIPISIVKNSIRLPNDKYYGINFTNIDGDSESRRIEFRYIGGKDYHKNAGQLLYFMDSFIVSTYDSITNDFSEDDIDSLEVYLEENIRSYKNLSKYENFITSFPNVVIQIDQISDFSIVSAYYDRIHKKLYDIIDSVESLTECIINYVSKTNEIEIVDANIKATKAINRVDLISCKVEGLFDDCYFIDSEIINSHLTKSKIKNSDADNTKLFNCNVDSSVINNCYFMDGYLNGDMRGGVWRSGKLGPYATLDSDVKIVKDYDNFFDTRFDQETKGDKQGIMKSFGKIPPKSEKF
jgi:hypothetical protein